MAAQTPAIGSWSQAITERKALNSSARDEPSDQLPPIVPALTYSLNFRTAFLHVASWPHPLITFQRLYDISDGHARDLQKSSSQPLGNTAFDPGSCSRMMNPMKPTTGYPSKSVKVLHGRQGS
ncbi:hypothetical protein E4U50_000255, partial [Claviceps purpurea]